MLAHSYAITEAMYSERDRLRLDFLRHQLQRSVRMVQLGHDNDALRKRCAAIADEIVAIHNTYHGG